MDSQDQAGAAGEKTGYQASVGVWIAEENERRQHIRQIIVTKLHVFWDEIHGSQWFLLTAGFQWEAVRYTTLKELVLTSANGLSRFLLEGLDGGSITRRALITQPRGAKSQRCWWWRSLDEHCEDISGDAQQYFSLETTRPNSALLISLHPKGDPLGQNEEEKQYSNPDEASLFANTHRIRGKWRQDVNHCWSPSFSWLLGGKSVCLYFLLFS